MQQAFGNHGYDQVALAAAFGGDQVVEAQPADSSEDGLDVPMGQALLDLKGVGGRQESFAGQRPADDVDEGFGQVGDIAEGFVFDLLTDAKGAAEEVGAVSSAFVAAFRGGYVNSA
jgi:hypothetical protein